MNRIIFLITGVLLTACTVQAPVVDDATSQSSSMISSAASSSSSSEEYMGPPPMNQASHSGSYTNTSYGFSLNYPTHFEPLGTPYWPVKRLRNSRIINNTLENDQQDALFALAARDREIPSEFGMTVAVYPLEAYSHVNIYDDEYVYNTASGTWTKAMAQKPFEPTSHTYNGLTMYEFIFGDAGHFSRTFAVLHPTKGIVVEMTVGGCLGCIRNGGDTFENQTQEFYDEMDRHADADTERILESFRWIE